MTPTTFGWIKLGANALNVHQTTQYCFTGTSFANQPLFSLKCTSLYVIDDILNVVLHKHNMHTHAGFQACLHVRIKSVLEYMHLQSKALAEQLQD